jgi:SM-20-related protein
MGNMQVHDQIEVMDDFVPLELQQQFAEFASRPIWGYGWRSNEKQDRYCFWHAHFAGKEKSRTSCLIELAENPRANEVFGLWNFLANNVLKGHEPLRVYANAHTYGVEGYIHADSTNEENYFTTIYYAHPAWRKNWAGEINFYSRESDEIIKSVIPRPGRLVHFPGSILHKAQAPGRECPELRISIVIKTQRASLD